MNLFDVIFRPKRKFPDDISITAETVVRENVAANTRVERLVEDVLRELKVDTRKGRREART